MALSRRFVHVEMTSYPHPTTSGLLSSLLFQVHVFTVFSLKKKAHFLLLSSLSTENSHLLIGSRCLLPHKHLSGPTALLTIDRFCASHRCP